MRFSINTVLFVSPVYKQGTPGCFKRFKQWGFDAVELLVEAPSHIDPAYVKSRVGQTRAGLWFGLRRDE